MSTHLCITVRWIGDRFHGFVEGTESTEWPPSPFRLFQAFVASAYRHGMTDSRRHALVWLERQQVAPTILALSDPATGVLFDHWVPDNDNLVDHRKGSIRKFRPILHGDRPVTHYVWEINPVDPPPIDAVDDLASTLGWFGWAIDTAWATAKLATVAQIDSTSLPSNQLYRFQPVRRTTVSNGSLRVAKSGSFKELETVFVANRIAFSDQTQRRKRKWPKAFDRFIYSGLERPEARPHLVFKLVAPNGEDPARYPHAKLMHIAAMTRSLAIKSCKAAGYDPEFVSRFVRGKNEPAIDDHKQISYVPLPSIGHEHADAMIRNVMLVAPIGMDEELARVVRAIDGRELIPERDDGEDSCEAESVVPANYRAELQSFNPPKNRFIAKCYLGSSCMWETVTPVILDEHAKKVDRKNEETGEIEKVWNHNELICLALKRAGIETPCRFIWQSIPFLKNCLSAHKYDREKKRTGYYRPKRLDGKTTVHVRITFDHPVPGPITIGAGRHCGFGLMAAIDP